MGRLRKFAGFAAGFAALAGAPPLLAQTVTDPTSPAPAAAATPSQPPPAWSFTAAYTADLLDDVAGGMRTGGGYVHLIKLSAAYDGTSGGHDGLTGLVSIEHANGSNFTTLDVGGVQAVSSSEAQVQALRLYEVWLQQAIGEQGGVKAGLIDLNTTFDVQETAALFLNASHGIGPEISDTGLNGSSDYPTPALAVAAFYRPAKDLTLQLGVFDAVAGDPAHLADFVAVRLDGGALVIGQVEKRFGDTARIEAGAWTYTSAFPALDRFSIGGAPRALHGNDGLYGLVEGRLMAKPGDKDGGLSGWLRLGVANGDINPVSSYLGVGLVYTGLVTGRDKDEIGFAVARAGLGAGARFTGALAGRRIGQAETNLEATYRYAFRDWLNIQPDVQYVINPRGDEHISNALVIGLRLAFAYSK